jgi:predicted mannosyl-3-phosphoglycerate phosphatase (HAD superfamily)
VLPPLLEFVLNAINVDNIVHDFRRMHALDVQVLEVINNGCVILF